MSELVSACVHVGSVCLLLSGLGALRLTVPCSRLATTTAPAFLPVTRRFVSHLTRPYHLADIQHNDQPSPCTCPGPSPNPSRLPASWRAQLRFRFLEIFRTSYASPESSRQPAPVFHD